MARKLCRFLLALAILYGLAVGLYAWFGYDGARPDAITVAKDFHHWIASRIEYRYKPPSGAPPPAPTPPPDTGPTAVPPPRPPPPPPSSAAEAVERVSRQLLPNAEQQARTLTDRSAPDFEIRRTATVVTLNQARDLLGPLLDTGNADPEVQRLYKRVMDLLTAVRKK